MKKIVLLIFAVSLFTCKKPTTQTTEERLSALSLFTMGKVFLGEKEFEANQIFQENDLLKLEPKSICDLQIQKKDWTFRIKGTALFQLKRYQTQNQKEATDFVLQEGKFLFNFNQKLNPNETVRVLTPTTVTGVRGTKFSLEVDKSGITKLILIEGSVSLSPIATTDLMTAKTESIVPKKEIIIDKETEIKIDPQIAEDWNRLSNLPEEEFSKQIEGFRKKTLKPASQNSLKELTTELGQLKSIPVGAFQNSESIKVEIEKRNQQNSAEILKTMERISEKKAGVLTLTNGEELKGIIEQNDKTYSIEMPSGKRTFNEAEVLSAEYDK